MTYSIKFRETKQKIVAFIATAYKALLTIAKTNQRLSGRKLYTGNVYYFFWNFLHHIPLSAYKKVRNQSCAPKNANSKLSPNELIR